MLFNSFDFLFFLPIVFVLYWHVFRSNLLWQNLFAVAASYVFYGWWDWRFLVLIVFTSLCSYGSGLLIERCARQDNFQCGCIKRHPYPSKQCLQTICKKIEVFEYPKHQQVHHDVQSRPPLGTPQIIQSETALNKQSTAIAAQTGKDNQQQKPPVPPTIEHIAGRHNKHILPSQSPLEYMPIQHEHDRQEDQKIK